MKKIILLFALFLIPFAAFGQKEKLDHIFNRYENSEGVTSIKISKPMFRMLDNLKTHDESLSKIKPLLSKINSIKILIMEQGESGETIPNTALAGKLSQEIMSAVNKLNYEELMTVNSKDNRIKFLAANTDGKFLDNLLLSINSKDEQLLMMLDGVISMDDVSALANEASKN